MVWYVAIIAILNLGLGYVLAKMLGADKRLPSLAGDVSEFADPGDTV